MFSATVAPGRRRRPSRPPPSQKFPAAIAAPACRLWPPAAAAVSQCRRRRRFRPRIPPLPAAAAVHVLRMDVGNDDSVALAVASVLAATGDRVDVAVASAGYGVVMNVEDATVEDVSSCMNVNFYGAVRLVKAVVPAMRRRRAGRIFGVSSIAGLVGIPFFGPYSASKFAMEGFWECCAAEYKPLGVHFILVRWAVARSASHRRCSFLAACFALPRMTQLYACALAACRIKPVAFTCATSADCPVLPVFPYLFFGGVLTGGARPCGHQRWLSCRGQPVPPR